MTQQVIGIGTAANDGTGDPLRTAFTKTNANFTELYGLPSGGSPGGSNGQVQYNNSGAFGGATNFTISSGNPLIAIGGVLQYARLYNITNVAFAIDNTGGFGDLDWFLAGGGNFTLTSSGTGGNVCEGPNAGGALTTGYWNMVEGTGALASCTSGHGNLAFGRHAMNAMVSGSNNVAIGSGAMAFSTAGDFNMAVGVGTIGGVITSGNGNVGIGNSAAGSLAGASSDNILIGDGCAQNAQDLEDNVIIGGRAAQSIASSAVHNNTIVGTSAASHLTSGSHNVFLGWNVVSGASSASYNTVLGMNTAPTLSTGSQNIIIGTQCDIPSGSGGGQISIGNMIYGTNCTGVGASASSGQIGIGTSAPAVELDVAGRIKTKAYTVATLPAGVDGARAFVTDAASPVFGSAVAGSGAVHVPVFYSSASAAWMVG